MLLLTAFVLVHLLFESIDVPAQDVDDGLSPVLFMLEIILATSFLEQLVALTSRSTSGIVGQAYAVQFKALVVLALAPSTCCVRVFLFLLLEELLLSLGAGHDLNRHFLDLSLFLLLLLLLLKDRPPVGLPLEYFGLIIFLGLNLLSYAWVLLKLQATVAIVLSRVRVVVTEDLLIVDVKVGSEYVESLLIWVLSVQPNLVS